MLDSELLRLLTGELRRPIYIGRITERAARAIGAQKTAVWLSPDTVKKQEIRHRHPNLELYRLAPTVLRSKFILVEPPNNVVFVYHAPGANRRSYKAVVKRTADGNELYLASIQRVRRTDVRSIYRRAIRLTEWEKRSA